LVPKYNGLCWGRQRRAGTTCGPRSRAGAWRAAGAPAVGSGRHQRIPQENQVSAYRVLVCSTQQRPLGSAPGCLRCLLVPNAAGRLSDKELHACNAHECDASGTGFWGLDVVWNLCPVPRAGWPPLSVCFAQTQADTSTRPLPCEFFAVRYDRHTPAFDHRAVSQVRSTRHCVTS